MQGGGTAAVSQTSRSGFAGVTALGKFIPVWCGDALRLIPRRAGHSRGPRLESGRTAAVSETSRSAVASQKTCRVTWAIELRTLLRLAFSTAALRPHLPPQDRRSVCICASWISNPRFYGLFSVWSKFCLTSGGFPAAGWGNVAAPGFAVFQSLPDPCLRGILAVKMLAVPDYN
jgi:hypothetical protein